MDCPTNLPFNRAASKVMHLDLNSCFASIEQQANPRLRGKPIAVAAYTTPSGCIVAPSIEAKRHGLKTGMRVREGKLLCPELIVLAPDPEKYRDVHRKLARLLRIYTDNVRPKSIDEFVVDFTGCPAYRRGMHTVAQEIKDRIRREIGDWMTVSIGIAPNRFLAKTAAALHKPDGLDEINYLNYAQIYAALTLTDLCGIDKRNAARLHNVGIFTVLEFAQATPWHLRSAFRSICGHYWFYRLRGWEIDAVDFGRKSYGNSYSLPEPLSEPQQLAPILQKLVEKMSVRLRKGGYRAQGVHLALLYRDDDHWQQGITLPNVVFAAQDIYKEAYRLLCRAPERKPVKTLAVSCFKLQTAAATQLALFEDVMEKERLVAALDDINERYGHYVITPAHMIGYENSVPDRIAFGGIKELTDFVTDMSSD